MLFLKTGTYSFEPTRRAETIRARMRTAPTARPYLLPRLSYLSHISPSLSRVSVPVSLAAAARWRQGGGGLFSSLSHVLLFSPF